MKRKWKVLLCGYYGMGNLGDELLASSAIYLLNKCGLSENDIAMLSGNTEESFQIHHVTSFNRWNISSILKALLSSETLLLGGGGIFQDTSSIRSPWYYWGIMRAAKLCGCRVWAVGQSIGPLNSKSSRFAACSAFRCCDAVSVRDERSADFLNGRCVRSDDLVLALPDKKTDNLPREYFLINLRRTKTRLEYKAAEAASALHLPKGIKLAGIAFDREDAVLMKELSDAHIIHFDELFIPQISQVDEIFDRSAGAFGMRLHFGVLCLRHGVPCTLIPYAPKVTDFAVRWGAETWCSGEMKMPRKWMFSSDLSSAYNNVQKDFYKCFRKVMSFN
jgi:polysaccharide pyruvyl transferase CsaB